MAEQQTIDVPPTVTMPASVLAEVLRAAAESLEAKGPMAFVQITAQTACSIAIWIDFHPEAQVGRWAKNELRGVAE